jgi:hypothetical protein
MLKPPLPPLKTKGAKAKSKARGQKEKGKSEKDVRINAVPTTSRQVTLSINGKTI